MAKLINGNYKTIDLGIPLVRVDNDVLSYFDVMNDETKTFQIEYGAVSPMLIPRGYSKGTVKEIHSATDLSSFESE